jgi:O-antigen/teichoic acid export membrane protein
MGVPVLLLALFSKELFLVWLGENFAEQCAPVFQILALGIFVNSLSFIPYNLIHGAGRPDITAKFHLLELPFYIGAAFFLIQKFGIVGAASAWTLRAGVDSLLVFGASWKLSPSTLPALAQNGILRAIVAFSGFTLLTVLAAALNKLLLIKIILAVALTMIFWIIVWKFILDSAEKKYFQALLNFLKRGLG